MKAPQLTPEYFRLRREFSRGIDPNILTDASTVLQLKSQRTAQLREPGHGHTTEIIYHRSWALGSS